MIPIKIEISYDSKFDNELDKQIVKLFLDKELSGWNKTQDNIVNRTVFSFAVDSAKLNNIFGEGSQAGEGK